MAALLCGSRMRGSPSQSPTGEEEVDALVDGVAVLGALHGGDERELADPNADLLAGLATSGVVRRLTPLDVPGRRRSPVAVSVTRCSGGVATAPRRPGRRLGRAAAGRRTTRGRLGSGRPPARSGRGVAAAGLLLGDVLHLVDLVGELPAGLVVDQVTGLLDGLVDLVVVLVDELLGVVEETHACRLVPFRCPEPVAGWLVGPVDGCEPRGVSARRASARAG